MAPTEPRAPKAGPPAEPAPPRGRTALLAALGLALVVVLVESLLGAPAARSIRYDELKRAIAADRVAWVQLTPTEIRGRMRPDVAPPSEDRGGPAALERFTTGRVDDDALLALLERHRVPLRGVADSGWRGEWPWLVYLGLSAVVMLALWGGLFRRLGGAAGSALSFGRSRGKLFQETDVRVSFEDVAGVEEAKEELREIIDFLKSPEPYRAIGARIPKGVLLVGPSGTGKTLLARAVAGEAKVPFISINGSEFVEMFVGVGAARVRDLFEQAARSAPCIVFIDELDALGRSRAGAAVGPGSNEEREQTLNQLLVEMDGFEPRSAVIIMAATNRPEILDPALLRPGRFDRQVLVDRPDRRGREEILRVHVRGVRLDASVDLSVLAARTPGFAGADLANLVNEAALLAVRRGANAVAMGDLSAALDRVVAGLEKKSRLIGEDEKRRIAYHESGHALATALAGGGDEVHKISIVPRGMSALGYTMQLPSEERYLMTESAVQAKLVGLLGGRAAELLVFGEPSTGAQNDLARATDLARAMVTEYGMSRALGPLHVGYDRRPLFLRGADGGSLGLARDVGGALTDLVDAETRAQLEAAERRAVELLRTHRVGLTRIAERLLEAEQLERDELGPLLEEARRASVPLAASDSTAAHHPA